MHPLPSMSPSTFTCPLITATAIIDKTIAKQTTNLSVSLQITTTNAQLSKFNYNINKSANVSLQPIPPISTTVN